MDQRHQSNFGQVEADGVTSDSDINAACQECTYIPPGDERKEVYRLSTFEQFPITSSETRKALAKSGFFFTGYLDRVKCFACGRSVQSWKESDSPLDRKWHQEDCALQLGFVCGNVPLTSLLNMPKVAGIDPQNVPEHNGNSQNQSERNKDSDPSDRYGDFNQPSPPNVVSTGIKSPKKVTRIGSQVEHRFVMARVISDDHKQLLHNLLLNRELDRLASFARWGIDTLKVSPTSLAMNGFFYLGDMDRVQCFSCEGVLRNWSPDDDAATEHARHFPSCKMAMAAEPRNVPVATSPETVEELEQKYSCRNPANARMGNEQLRLKTFDDRWPSNKTNATPVQIAEAGFFFLGDRDRAKCWYCNGGLQNWEQEDDPWVEHAKWFPTCEFLLRRKSTRFVHNHLKNNAHLPRPAILRPENRQPSRLRRLEEKTLPPSAPSLPPLTPPFISPQEAVKQLQGKVQTFMENSEIVKFILDMGYQQEIVAAQVENKIISCSGDHANSDVYGSVFDLLDDIQKNMENLTKQVDEKNTTEEDIRKSAKEEGRQEAMEDVKNEQTCKVCFSDPTDIVFVPCGHLCCCSLCASTQTNCPVCRTVIRQCIKVFRA